MRVLERKDMFSKSYPQVYRGNNGACLMLDKSDGYVLGSYVAAIDTVPDGFKRVEWTDLNLLEQQKADAILSKRNIQKDAESLFALPEYEIAAHYQGYLISKRRIKRHHLPTYYVAGQGFKLIREAKAYVRSLQKTPA